MLVRAMLEAEGYTIVDAEDGLSGIEAAVREEPALILLDVNLPGVDGYEVVAVIKSFPDLATTPVVAVTAYAMEGDRQRTLVAGCDGYIQKPIDVDTFPRQVAEFLRGKREQVEERERGRLPPRAEPAARLPAASTRSRSSSGSTSTSCAGPPSSPICTARCRTSPPRSASRAMLEQLLPALSRALGTRSLSVELPEPDVRWRCRRQRRATPRSVLAGTGRRRRRGLDGSGLALPLTVRGRHARRR